MSTDEDALVAALTALSLAGGSMHGVLCRIESSDQAAIDGAIKGWRDACDAHMPQFSSSAGVGQPATDGGTARPSLTIVPRKG